MKKILPLLLALGLLACAAPPEESATVIDQLSEGEGVAAEDDRAEQVKDGYQDGDNGLVFHESFADGSSMRLTASSRQADTDLHRFSVGNLRDGNPATAWREGAPGEGREEWVMIKFSHPTQVAGLNIDNGWQQDEATFTAHGRVKRLRVEGQSLRATLELEDVMGPQSLPLPKPEEVTWLRLTIVETFPGSESEDTFLSGLKIARKVLH